MIFSLVFLFSLRALLAVLIFWDLIGTFYK